MIFWAKNQRCVVSFWPKVVQDKWSQRTVLDLPLCDMVHYWLKQFFCFFSKNSKIKYNPGLHMPWVLSKLSSCATVSLKRLAIFTLAKLYSHRIVGILGTQTQNPSLFWSVKDSVFCWIWILDIETALQWNHSNSVIWGSVLDFKKCPFSSFLAVPRLTWCNTRISFVFFLIKPVFSWICFLFPQTWFWHLTPLTPCRYYVFVCFLCYFFEFQFLLL